MPRTLPVIIFLLLLSLASAPASMADGEEPAEPGPDRPTLAMLAVERTDGQYVASFRLDAAFDQETLGKISSGLETVFDYRLEVVRRRRFWLDERTIQRRILASVRYDSLSKQYSLTLKVDGEVERSSTTDKPEEMRRWMTEIRGIPLGPVSGFTPPQDYLVRVKSSLQPRFVLLFIPWDRDTPWLRVPLAGAGPESHAVAR